MGKIRVLPEELAHKIAAGEVVERPASVVKELVENSIDAHSTRITVDIKEGGKEYIRVSDDGIGMDLDDLKVAFHRHATSKIASVEDLFNINTLGFRGEALPSIASVSQLNLRTRVPSQTQGHQVSFDKNNQLVITPVGTSQGTIIEVRKLFYNTPARYKFLKTTATERRYIIDFVTDISLAHPHISFQLVIDGKSQLQTGGTGRLKDTLSSIYGAKIAGQLIELNQATSWGKVSGYVGPPQLARGNRSAQTIILNGRIIKSLGITYSVERAYHGLLAHRQYPWGILVINIDPQQIDVNVHPTKAEVRMENERLVCQDIQNIVKQALLSKDISENLQTSEQRPKPMRQQPVQSKFKFEPSINQWNPDSWDEVDSLLRKTTGDVPANNKPLLGIKNQARQSIGSATTVSEQTQVSETPPPEHREHTQKIRDELLNARIIGQLHQTYILLETVGGLWLLDQHIVHERILYEKFSNRDKDVAVQQIIPETLEFSAGEADLVAEYLGELRVLGIELESFGANTFILRGIPGELAKEKTGWNQVILEIIDAQLKGENWQDKAAISLACKGAIKAGDYLTNRQIHGLLAQLAATENPFTCPHGRPIIVKLESQELLRRFGRL